MSTGSYLQIAGAICELGGLGAVAWGIADTREHFTERPSIARRAWARVLRVAARFRRRRSQTVKVGAAELVAMAASVKARGRTGFGPWDDEALEERIERLRRAFENQERIMDDLHERLDGEENARREADDRHERHAEEIRRELLQLVSDAAAGGLRLETIGVCLFALGVLLGTWGNLLG